MAKIQLNDPLASDRTLYTSRIEGDEFEHNHTGTENSISLYDAFSFTKSGSAKIASQRTNTRLRNLKGNITIKHSGIFELMKMLALSENRYCVETNKLTQAISNTMFLNNIGTVGIISMMKPLVRKTVRMLKSTYLFRWKANVGYQLASFHVLPKRKLHAKKVFAGLRKWIRREMIKTFVEVRERACLVDGIKRRRPSVKSIGSKYSPSNERSLESSMYMRQEKRVDDRTKKEFKKSISNKFKADNKSLERSVGSSYFRNNEYK
jgi:hypothetical protein